MITGDPKKPPIFSVRCINFQSLARVNLQPLVTGYRGVDQDNPTVEIIHRGKYKSLTRQQRRWLKRRQAVEPAIGHLKSDHRMDRCWLQGQLGDALHAVLCAAGYNLRWLLRAMVRLGLSAAFLRSLLRWLVAVLSHRRSVTDSYEPNDLVFSGAV